MPSIGMTVPERLAIRRNRSYRILPDGRIEVDPGKRGISFFTLLTQPNEVYVPAATDFGASLLAGGVQAEPALLPIDNKGPFEAVYSSCKAVIADGEDAGTPTSQFTVAMFDPDNRNVIMNREIHIRTMAGGFGSALGAGVGTALSSAAGRPLVWPETLFMEPNDDGKAMFIGFRNLTTRNIKVRFALHGVRYWNVRGYQEARREKEDLYGKGRVSMPYFYTPDTNIRLAGGASANYPMRITDDADCEIFKMTKWSDYDFLWRIYEADGQRYLDSAGLSAAGAVAGVHSDFGFGDAEFPMIPVETYYQGQNSQVYLQIANTLTQNQNRIWPTFVCRRIKHVPAEW